MNKIKSADVSGAEAAPGIGLRSRLKFFLITWSLFFLICLSLGYPTLSRFDPSRVPGLSDAAVYYRMVLGEEVVRTRAEVFGGRVLIPYTARFFYRFSASHLRSWNPVFFSLLVTNALFCATTAMLIAFVGQRLLSDLASPLLGATLYLLNFAIPNLQLAGLIDSGEALFMMAVVSTLIVGKWKLLPLWGVGGALAKETFMPFAAIFVFVWWWLSGKHRINLLWWLTMILLSNLTLILTRLVLYGRVIWPWEIASAMRSDIGLWAAFVRCISDRSFWYIFVWLVPLGIWKLKWLPRQWVFASLFGALTALGFGVYNDMAGTVGRPIFNIIGPMLSLSAALLLVDFARTNGSKGRVVPVDSIEE